MPLQPIRPSDRWQQAVFGKTTLEANVKGQCVTCPKPDLKFANEKESREYIISGMCARCQREIFSRQNEER
jgi:hypothetical protein